MQGDRAGSFAYGKITALDKNRFIINCISRSPEETRDIGFRLGKLLKAGDIVGLFGDLGAGKTMLSKGIAKAFGIDERDIVSASFTFITEYETDPPFVHIDLYRIGNDTELAELGLWSHIRGDSISVIEWAENAGAALSSENIIRVSLKYKDEDTRELFIEGMDEKDWNHR
jgi:tRNA threonylcarbamoyladenosine biosynthesis protein TsaE